MTALPSTMYGSMCIGAPRRFDRIGPIAFVTLWLLSLLPGRTAALLLDTGRGS